MRDIERMHSTIFDIFLTEAKIYQMFSMAKCKKKCQINVAELISCPCRAILPCLLIKFYGLISLCKAEWATLIGRDCRDTVLSLVKPYYAGAKVYAITTYLKWLPCTERINYRRPYAIKNQ